MLAGPCVWNIQARAAEDGNDNSQGDEQVATIPANATGKLQRGVTDAKGPGKQSSQVKNLIDHGGPVVAASKTYFILWGPPVDFPTDVDNLTSLAQGMTSSSYLGIMQQYMRGTSISSTYMMVASDISAPPSRGPQTNTIVNEACKMIAANQWPLDSNALYTVVTSNFPRINYCAWHSHGTCNGVDIKVAYIPNASGVAGCDPGNLYNCNKYSQGTRSMADSWAHEFSEAITDPDINAWYDSGGAEIGDKCNFTYAACVNLGSGNSWQLQEEWSNANSACKQQ
jgi:hypothetical protein